MTALAVCPTYGRLPYLGRMLASFLHQEYSDKHLVIVNDDKNIELKCASPMVTILNCSQRMIIGEKRNLGTAFGHYDIIFPWDDDDVFLPNRMNNHIQKYSDENIKAYRNYSTYIIYGDEFTTADGTPNDISFRKSEWFKLNGYQEKTWIGEDTEFFNKLIDNIWVENNPDNKDYVYNFGGVNYHLSCNSNPDSLEEIAFNQLKTMGLVGKTFWIEPDFEEYFKFLKLDSLYKKVKMKIPITHNSDAKITIPYVYHN